MTDRDEQIAKAVIEACAKKGEEMFIVGSFGIGSALSRLGHNNAVRHVVDAVRSLSPADLVAALPKQEPAARIPNIAGIIRTSTWQNAELRESAAKLVSTIIQECAFLQEPIAWVKDNNQPGWTNIVETAPNVTLAVGEKLYAAAMVKNNPCEKHISVEADGYCPICLMEQAAPVAQPDAEEVRKLDELFSEWLDKQPPDTVVSRPWLASEDSRNLYNEQQLHEAWDAALLAKLTGGK